MATRGAPSSIYWPQRTAEALAAIEKEEKKTKIRLEKYFSDESERLKKEIASYYSEYGENGVVEFRKLLQTMTPAARQQLYRDFDSYIRQHPERAHLKEIRESIYKLNRLEGLQASVELQLAKVGDTETREISDHLEKVGVISWEAASDMLGNSVNPDVARRYVNAPWANGESFSERIWNDTGKLAGYINTDISQGFARGDAYRRMVKTTTERFQHVAARDAYRLIYTEGTFVYNSTSADAISQYYNKYQISTAGDSKVCKICRGLEGMWFTFSERMPGANFPPLHPWCRCSFIVDTEREGEEEI